MEDLTRAPDDNPQPPIRGGDRRAIRRGHLSRFWNLFYGLLRKSGMHAKSFYGTVGIFLVAGVVIGILGAYGFAQLAEVVKKGYTQRYDEAILSWIHTRQSASVTTFMREMTYLGTGTVVIVVVGVAALFLWHTEHKHSARLLMASTVGGIILNNALKLLFHRERPSLFEWGTSVASSSFPSGHAMSATVVYGTIAYLLARLQKRRWARALTLTAAFVLILTICFTRLYLGVHYPSDVVGGIIVGLAWAGFCMATLEASLVIARRRAPASVVEERPAPKEMEAASNAASEATSAA
jgi:undecaprenyl-diphosphatase